MKAILAPTDFSECANAAVDAAFQWAMKDKAIVHLFHSYQTESVYTGQLMDHYKDLINKYSSVQVASHVFNGKLLDGIQEYIQQLNIDFLVIGSHGTSGKSEFFIGSNAQKMVRMAKTPVFIVKDRIEELQFNKVIFASNFNANEKEPFRKFLAIIKPFNPKVYLVNIDTPSLFDSPFIIQKFAMDDFAEIADPLESEVIFVKHFSVDAGVRLFSSEIQADLVAISNHNRNPFKRIISGSNVEALVNHVEIPVLTIDYKSK